MVLKRDILHTFNYVVLLAILQTIVAIKSKYVKQKEMFLSPLVQKIYCLKENAEFW